MTTSKTDYYMTMDINTEEVYVYEVDSSEEPTIIGSIQLHVDMSEPDIDYAERVECKRLCSWLLDRGFVPNAPHYGSIYEWLRVGSLSLTRVTS